MFPQGRNTRNDVTYRLLGYACRYGRPHAAPACEWHDNDGKKIYFDSIDNSAYILGKTQHSARRSWVYIDGEIFQALRADISGDPQDPWVNVAWKFIDREGFLAGSRSNLGLSGTL